MRRRSAPAAALLVAALALTGCTSSGPTARTATPGTTAPATGRHHASAPADAGVDPAATVAPLRPGPRTATVLGSGDVLIHPPLWMQAHRDAQHEGRSGYDFGPMYASIAPDVRAPTSPSARWRPRSRRRRARSSAGPTSTPRPRC